MPKVKATNSYKIHSILKKFPEEFLKNRNDELYCNLCNCTLSCCERFLIDDHRKTSKHQKEFGNRSEQLIPHTSHSFLESSHTDFLEMVTKKFLSADIPLYKLNKSTSKTFFVTLVTVCHMKLLVDELCCN